MSENSLANNQPITSQILPCWLAKMGWPNTLSLLRRERGCYWPRPIILAIGQLLATCQLGSGKEGTTSAAVKLNVGNRIRQVNSDGGMTRLPPPMLKVNSYENQKRRRGRHFRGKSVTISQKTCFQSAKSHEQKN